MAVMMRSMLEVADNSGARKLDHASGRLDRSSRWLGRRDHRQREGSVARRTGAEGQSGEGSHRADAERASAAGWNVYPLRFECRCSDQRRRRAGGHARIRASGARTAGEEVLENCVAGAGSALSVETRLAASKRAKEKQILRFAQAGRFE